MPNASQAYFIPSALPDSIATIHEPVVAGTDGQPQVGLGPQIVVFNTTVGLQFDDATDKIYRWFRIPNNYVSGSAQMHIHWTKFADLNAQGTTVRWRVSYVDVNGRDEDIALVAPTVIDLDDTYEDASVDGTRIVYATPNLALPDIDERSYIGFCVEFVPAGTTLTSDPVLISADLVYQAYINK